MASKRKHQNLELFNSKAPAQFGGSLVKGHAKKQRPLSRKDAVHVVLKSKVAIRKLSMLAPKFASKVQEIVLKQARKFKIKIYEFVNVGNHLHLAVKLPNVPMALARKLFQNFLRAVAGLIARLILGAEKGSDSKLKFWTFIPFTRLVKFGRAYRALKDYMEKNRDDALGVLMRWGHFAPDP